MKNVKTITRTVFCSIEDILYSKECKPLLNILVTGFASPLNSKDKALVKQVIKNKEIPDFLDCDPDYIRFEGFNEIMETEGKSIAFEEWTYKNIRYIYSYAPLPEVAKNMLTSFFSNNYENDFISVESTWLNFWKLTNGIAYRGGAGYSYAIWEFDLVSYLKK